MPIIKTNPMKLPGPWVEGYVLDYHSFSAKPLGNNQYDMSYTELGRRVYRFKYRSDRDVLPDLVDTAEDFIRQRKWTTETVVPTPFSINRKSQPVAELAEQLASRLNVPICENAVLKVKKTPSMKNVPSPVERQLLLRKAIQAGPGDVIGKSVLLIDDLYDSGSTLQRVAEVLTRDCAAKSVYALVLTRTR